MIGVSLGVRTTDEALAALAEVAAVADIAELRLDFMAEYDLPRLLAARPCPVIVTNRPEREGGRFTGAEADRLRPLHAAIGLGADYVDIEHDSVSLLPAQRGTTQVIVSFHDFTATPPTLPRIAARMQEQGADVVKVVGMAQHPADNRYVLETFDQARPPTIAIGMGVAGLPSRVLALRYEQCFLTYATLGKGEQVAPGQLPVAAMHAVYQASAIGAGHTGRWYRGADAPGRRGVSTAQWCAAATWARCRCSAVRAPGECRRDRAGSRLHRPALRHRRMDRVSAAPASLGGSQAYWTGCKTRPPRMAQWTS